jgi:hypothetical protein
MVAVPAATPVTTPEALTVATAVLEEDHVPPAVASASVVVEATQTEVVPVMPATVGNALTVTAAVALPEQPPAFVTV